jgi:hypothetical protein
LESEQEELRNTIATTKEEERAAVARWKRAERQLAELEKQLERIQREHALERVRSQNILERMEQRKLASQQAGTFPSALTADKSALSRFMKEILAENGHLQLGVAELRDLLAQSQEEVKMLREKLESLGGGDLDLQPDMGRSPLSMELEAGNGTATANGAAAGVVVHHHHYHTAPGSKAKLIKPPIRRPKKRRGVTVDHLDTLRARGYDPESSSMAHKRWSTSTGTAPLSSSPTSTFQDSIFDRENGEDTSRPTTADSNYPQPWPKQSWARHSRKSSMNPPFTILHTTEEVSSEAESVAHSERATSPQPPMSPPRNIPMLKRSVSHESLLSVSAMDMYNASAAHSGPSSFASLRNPNLRQNGVKPNDPQASITPGVAIRDQRSGQYSGSAYSRLLGLAEGASPPKQTASKKSSTASNTGGGGWFWKYVTLAPGGSKPGRSEAPKLKPPTTKPVPAFMDEDLLKESLVEGPGLS